MGTFVVKWICSKIIPSMGCLYELGLIFRPTLWPALVILGSKFSINVTSKVDWSSLFRNFSGICRGSIFDVSKNAVWEDYWSQTIYFWMEWIPRPWKCHLFVRELSKLEIYGFRQIRNNIIMAKMHKIHVSKNFIFDAHEQN